MAAWLQAMVAKLRDVAERRAPVLSAAIGRALEVELFDRAAALALFTMLAAVPGLLGALSVAGLVFSRVGEVAEFAGWSAPDDAAARAQLLRVIREALPGVTWDPASLADALAEHRTANGVVGTVGTLIVGANLMARLDAAVRAVLGRQRRSFWQAAGALSIAFVAGALIALLLTFLTPLLEWGLRVATGGLEALAFGWIDAVSLAVAAGQVLPIAVGFAVLVRWSAGRRRLGRRRLWGVALVFGALWFLGQRAFSIYVQEIALMSAIYGALTGVVALMLWLYYATSALLMAVAVLDAWERHARKRGDVAGLRTRRYPAAARRRRRPRDATEEQGRQP